MTDQELQALVKHISLRDFGKAFKHQAIFNSRLKTTGGRYHLTDHHIDINPKMLTNFGTETLEGIIKHELVHYHLHLAGLSGKYATKAFKQLLAAVGGLRYAPRLKSSGQLAHAYEYQCQTCGQVYVRRRHINVEKYVCSRCRGRLSLIGERTINSEVG
ncbi:SprT family protein [Secundilactobacillus kimchicus]|uniref:SprT family protein n=1 Tax=Secundilactobacillus kimchicus TaxID=528209 RepID=UPI0024A9C43D|nr:SprT family protein [Secundilactobacillus kimchicus]